MIEKQFAIDLISLNKLICTLKMFCSILLIFYWLDTLVRVSSYEGFVINV